MDAAAGTAEGGFIMNGSGCKNCPVKPCETINYRGSTCSAQRAKYGLGDPMTNGDRIRAMSDEQLAEFLLSPLDLCAKCKETGKHCIVGFSSKHNEHCMNTMAKWIKQTVEGE